MPTYGAAMMAGILLPSLGRARSHGCINLSPENAEAFLKFSRVGDVVFVSGSPRGPEFGDHGVMDWSTPWNEWTPTP